MSIVNVKAYANNEVAFVAWNLSARIDGCLGFEIFREYMQGGVVQERVPLAAFVAFKGQSNPDHKAQNTSVWPVQKLTWRDLTLRKKRDGSAVRPDNVTVRYSIRPVGRWKEGMVPVVARVEKTQGVENTYKGKPIKLGYLGPAVESNTVLVTHDRTPFQSTFTNGILSGQWLVNALKQGDGKIHDGELTRNLKTVGQWQRSYLSGDVLTLMKSFFAQPGGRFYMALYELEDEELEDLIAVNASRISLILSNTGQGEDDDPGAEEGAKIWDARNAPARAKLTALAKTTAGFKLQNRMFNNAVQIGHNKFVVWVDNNNVARSVLTGSTNWTWSGLCGQSNNCIRIDQDDIAAQFYGQWQCLNKDVIPEPADLGDPMPDNKQGVDLRDHNHNALPAVSQAPWTGEVWFSPNMKPRKYPPKNPPVPPDLDRVFSLMRKAKEAIFFLAFYPSVQGRNSIIDQAINLGINDKNLLVLGAVSESKAMFNYVPSETQTDGSKSNPSAPFVFQRNRTSLVRASALTDKMLMKPLGDFQAEILKVGQAIIHDKILVIDPLDPVNCVVAFGSHNLGFKASYSNDENMVIIRGHKALAEAYAVHVLDVYDHYRFRSAESQLRAEGKNGWDGFLSTSDEWQDHASTVLSDYFSG